MPSVDKRYQGAPKAVGKYVEIVGLQKLQIQSASLVAIGANPLDFFLTASPVLTTHTVLPGNLWFLFSRTYFFLPGTFFRKTFSDRKQVASLRIHRDPSTPPPSPALTVRSNTPSLFLRILYMCLYNTLPCSELLRPSMRSQSGRQGPLPAPHELSPRTCIAGIVALTPDRCFLAEPDTTARDNCAVAWRDRGESPPATYTYTYICGNVGDK